MEVLGGLTGTMLLQQKERGVFGRSFQVLALRAPSPER
jgi:hypothetical protein